MADCPSCGRYVGPYHRCPYCGADIGQRIAVRVLRYASMVVGIVGLAMLLLVARGTQTPTVEMGSLRGTMNWAYVRVEGLVTRQPSYDPQAQTLSFWVDDGTGSVLVMAYRADMKWLVSEGMVPAMGDFVALEGTLRIKEDLQYLVLDVPQQLEIWAAEPVEMAISEIGSDLLYQWVTVRGVLRDDRTPYEGLRIVRLRDATGEIDVVLPPTAAAWGGSVPDLWPGQSVQVIGAVNHYRGKPQISVGRGRDVTVLDDPLAIAPLRPTGGLSAMDVGKMVLVEGVVKEIQSFSAGVKYILDDGSGAVTLLLWQDLYQSLANRDTLVQGATVSAQGEVAEYGGELEIVPELPLDITITPTGDRMVAHRRLGDISAADLGQVVRVKGVLRSLRTFSAGVKGVLDDGTGTMTLLLWDQVYEGLSDPGSLAPGAVLKIEGEVREYRSEIEIVPLVPADVMVTGWVQLPKEERAIGQVTADDIGQTLYVAGQITKVIPFSRGVKCALDDGTGTITLLVWQELYDRLEEPVGLAQGAHVSVRGKIDEFAGDLEIVPQIPADLQVTMATPTPFPGPSATATMAPVFATTPKPAATAGPTIGPRPTPTRQPTPTVEMRTIASITGGDMGSTLTIDQAVIVEMDYFSQGVKFTIDDGSDRITLLIWQDVMEEIPARYDLVPMGQVRVTGVIEEYQGDLEIIPWHGAQIEVIVPGQRLPIEERQNQQVTPSDEGRIFVVEGQVTRIENQGWLKMWIDDGTGEIAIFVPTRTVAHLPAGIGPGVRLRVTGEVDIYQGELEIIPLAGADVKVQ